MTTGEKDFWTLVNRWDFWIWIFEWEKKEMDGNGRSFSKESRDLEYHWAKRQLRSLQFNFPFRNHSIIWKDSSLSSVSLSSNIAILCSISSPANLLTSDDVVVFKAKNGWLRKFQISLGSWRNLRDLEWKMNGIEDFNKIIKLDKIRITRSLMRFHSSHLDFRERRN